MCALPQGFDEDVFLLLVESNDAEGSRPDSAEREICDIENHRFWSSKPRIRTLGIMKALLLRKMIAECLQSERRRSEATRTVWATKYLGNHFYPEKQVCAWKTHAHEQRWTDSFVPCVKRRTNPFSAFVSQKSDRKTALSSKRNQSPVLAAKLRRKQYQIIYKMRRKIIPIIVKHVAFYVNLLANCVASL